MAERNNTENTAGKAAPKTRRTSSKAGSRPSVKRVQNKKSPPKKAREGSRQNSSAKQSSNGRDIKIDQRPRLQQIYINEAVPVLRQEFSYANPMQAPRPIKIVLNIGLGEALQNSKAVEAATEDLATISGQRPVVTKARKSIANYRLRAGMIVGATVTLRATRMWQFLDRLINIALPRVRDFHGVSRNSFDGRGNYSLGFSEQIIFPEIDYNRIDRLRGLQVTIVTSANADEEGLRLLELLGMPYTRVTDNSRVATVSA